MNLLVIPMEFTATESGYDNGLGGASNSKGTESYHYVLFGQQTDDQHPENSGIYFEFDDQIHGSVNCVARVVIADEFVEFELKDQKKIKVRRCMGDSHWNRFLNGIHDVFGDSMIQKA